ncbi:MAG: hypothetical protein IH986_12615 [Planctomycetes bacterium]|nr:hypothetical protein [Planctomycetota bacterium]
MKKTFDCIEMKRAGAKRLRARLEKMTRAVQLVFWRERTDALRRRADAVREKSARGESAPRPG